MHMQARRRFCRPTPPKLMQVVEPSKPLPLPGQLKPSTASPEMRYRTKYIRSELPSTTSPPIGTINNQLVHTRSANREEIK